MPEFKVEETALGRVRNAARVIALYKEEYLDEDQGPQRIVQILADIRLHCDVFGLDFEYLSEQSQGHARSYL